MSDVLGVPVSIRLTLPAITGNHIIADHAEWGYLRDYAAFRPPNEQEAAAYLHRYDFPDWSQWPALAEAGIAFETAPPPAPLLEPSQCSCGACLKPLLPPAEDGLSLPAREGDLPAPPEPDLGETREKALANWTALHDAEDAREATTTMPAAEKVTSLIPAAGDDRGDQK